MRIPGKAHGSEAVADVPGVFTGNDALAPSAAVTHDYVVLAEIKTLEGGGIERQQHLMTGIPGERP